ncbi:MAG: hypothetical protein WDW38_005064 [Sanguina aurantia]
MTGTDRHEQLLHPLCADLSQVELTPGGLRSLRAAAAILHPEVMKPIPESFDPDYKNPCWLDGSGMLSCLPAFYVAGVFHAGCSTLYQKLLRHPDILSDASSMNQMWGEEAKTMSGYLDNFNTAKQAVARDPARKLIADGSSSTFAQYWSAALKAHRGFQGTVVPCFAKCGNTAGATQVPAATCQETTCFSSAHQADLEVSRKSGIPFDRMHVPLLMRAVYGSRPPRLVVLARNPIQRLHSAYYCYQHYHSKYGRNAQGFLAYVEEQLNAFHKCVSKGHTERECVLYFETYGMEEERVHYHADQIFRGMYSVFLELWLQALPASHIHVVKSEEYFANASATIGSVVSFLGLAQPGQEQLQEMLAAGRPRSFTAGMPAMLPEARAILLKFYKPYNTRLAELLHDPRYLTWNV